MLKDFLKNSVSYGLVNVIQKACDYLVNIVFIYLLAASDYGVIMLLPTIIMLLSPVIFLSLNTAISRYYYKYVKMGEAPWFLGSVMSYSVLISCLLSVLFILFSAPLWQKIYPDIDFMPFIVLGILITVIDGINRMYITIMQIKKQVKRYAIYNNCYILLRLLVLFVTVYFFRTAFTYYLAYLVAVLLFLPVTFYLMKADVKWNMNRSYLKEAFSYAIYILPASVFVIANTFIDRHVIMVQLDMESVGIYSAGMSIGQIIYFMALVFNIAFFPFFMEKYEEKKNDFVTDIEPVYRIIFFCLNLSAFLFSILSPFLLYILPESYQGAIKIVPVIAFLGVAQGLYQVYTNILSLEANMLRLKMLGISVSLLINVVLSYNLVRLMGYQGAAYASMISVFISAFLYRLIAWKLKGPVLSNDFFILSLVVFIYVFMILKIKDFLPLWANILLYSLCLFPLFFYFNNFYFRQKNFLVINFKNLIDYVKNFRH